MCIRYKSPYHDDILLRREREKKIKISIQILIRSASSPRCAKPIICK